MGIVFYLLYTLRIGGDFMSGRYFAAPLLCAVMIAAYTVRFSLVSGLFTIILIFGLCLVSPYNPWASDANYRKISLSRPDQINSKYFDAHGIADERAYYYQVTGLLKPQEENNFIFPANHPVEQWIKHGKMLARANQPTVSVYDCIGFCGFYAGPKAHIVDSFALTDPLLATLPVRFLNSRIGHMERHIPEGYITSLRTGKTCFKDQNLACLYAKIANITQGPLFRWSRLPDIWALNSGYRKLVADLQPKPCFREPGCERILFPAQGSDLYAQLVNRGLQATFKNQWDLAYRSWLEAMQVDSSRPEAAGNLGVFYENTGDLKLAWKYYSIAAAGQRQPWGKYANQLQAVIGMQPVAAEHAAPVTPNYMTKRILAVAKDHGPYSQLINQGIQSAMQNDPGAAKSFWTRARELDPKQPEAYANLAVFLEREGKLGKALAYYQIAAKSLGRPWTDYIEKIKRKLVLQK